jgi:hypothetical protein
MVARPWAAASRYGTGSCYASGVNDVSQDAAATRLRTAFDLFDLALAMVRMRLIREDATLAHDEARLQVRVNTWLQHRPGAEHGDAEGRPR